MSAARSICFARSILCCKINWCGLFPVDLRNVCEKSAVLSPATSAIFVQTQLFLDLCMHQLRNPSQTRESQSATIRRRGTPPYRVTIDQRTGKFLFRGSLIQTQLTPCYLVY
jgi:hypothetical protein